MTRRRKLLRKFGLAAGAFSGALLLATLGFVAWLALGSGTLWTLQRLDAFSGGRMQVQGAAGDLLGKFTARSITLRTASADITLLGVQSEAAAFDGLFSVGKQTRKLHLRRLHIDEVVVNLRSSSASASAPTSLQLPLDISIDALEIDRVRTSSNTLAPLLNVRAALALQQDTHRVTGLSAQWDKLSIYGDAQVGTNGPLPVAAALGLAGAKAQNLPAWQAAITANGALAELAVTAELQAADQGLNASAVVAAWQPNPLPKLDATFTDWDISRVVSSAPRTALTGTAVVALAVDQPLQITVAARNSAAGQIDAGLLPVQRVDVQLEGAAKRWRVKTLTAEFAGATRTSNTLIGSGQWQDGPWALDLVLGNLALQQLDARWPAAVLAGSVRLSGVGAVLTTPIKLDAQLQGRLKEAAQIAAPLSLNARATVSWPSRVTLEQFAASAGAASVAGTLSAQQSTPTVKTTTAPSTPAWQIDATLAFSKLSSELLARAQAPNAVQNTQLNGSATARFSLAPGAAQLLQSGSANVVLSNSQIAGLPSSGRIDIAFAPLANLNKAAPWWAHQRITSRAALQLASNRLSWDGASGAPADVLSFTLDAPKLSDLSSVTKAAGAAHTSTNDALSGSVAGSGQFAGVWPAITSRGNAKLALLRVAGWALDNGTVSWQAALADNAPLTLELALQNLRPDAAPQAASPAVQPAGAPTVIEKLTVSVSGSTAQHRISASAVAMRLQRRVELTATASGAARDFLQWLSPSVAAGAGTGAPTPLWQATVQSLQAQEQVTTASAITSRLLLKAAPFDVAWTRVLTANRWQLSPGSAQVPALGAAALLRWQTASWQANGQANGQPDSIALSGELAPVAFADLRQLLPADAAQGLSGDLQLAATFALQSAPKLAVNVAIKRLSGDLLAGVENDSSANLLSTSDTALGLTDAALNLSVADGLWRVTHTLAGTRLGRLDADLSTRAVPPNLLPSKAAPVGGTLKLAVQNVAVWNALLPAGWRIKGGMSGAASLAGTLGVPQIQGSVELTDLALGNPLLGVDVKNGRGSVLFDGSRVQLRGVQFAGGSGLLAVEGSANLGDGKTLRLSLAAERFALLARIDRQAVISGKASVAVDDKRLKIDGKLRLDSGLIDISQLDAPSLSGDVIVTRRGASAGVPQTAVAQTAALQATGAQAQAPAVARPLLRAELALAVDLGNDFRVKGRGVDSLLRGELALSAPGGVLVAEGTLASARGTYAAYGQRLEIERGLVSFSKTAELGNPRLDVLAIRPNLEQRVGVAISGTAQAPRIKLYSEPEMPDTEKLALLVLGRGFDGRSQGDTALIQQAALALLAGEDGGLTGSLSRTLGLDTIALGARGTDVRETVVTLGKQISSSVYVGYERGLNSTTGTWQLIYRLSNRFTLRAQAGSDSTLDLIWSWKWQ